MGLRHSVVIVLGIAFVATTAVRAEQPATRPTIPALTVGAPPPRSFMARGFVRLAADGEGLAFHVATDGHKQVCALYDPADGTPLFLSDGQQTLVYDLANTRVILVPVSRGYIRVDWVAQEEKPLNFTVGVETNSDPAKLDEANSWFRIDRFVNSEHTLKQLATQDGTELFAAERKGGSVESLQRAPGDASWFRFKSKSGGESFYRLELHVTSIDKELPKNALAFPDMKRLPENVHLTELDQQMLPQFRVLLRNGGAWVAKMTLAAGPTVRDFAEKVMPNANWTQLRERDVTFGAAYRKALAEQGVELPTIPKVSTTQPTR